jgi:hypothetical protein
MAAMGGRAVMSCSWPTIPLIPSWIVNINSFTGLGTARMGREKINTGGVLRIS